MYPTVSYSFMWKFSVNRICQHGPKKSHQEEDYLPLSMVHELLDQQISSSPSFFKNLMAQQEKKLSFFQMFVDSTNLRVDNILKDI